MSVIAIANSKGGVGKTRTTVNLGAALAKAGKKVLIIDFDPQASVSNSLAFDEPEGQIYVEDLWRGEAEATELGIASVAENLFLIPTRPKQLSLINHSEFGRPTAFHKLKKNVVDVFRDDFDYILIDPPGETGNLIASVMIAAEKMIIPVRPSVDDFNTLREFLESETDLMEINPGLQSKLLFSQVDKRTNNRSYFEDQLDSEAWRGKIFDSDIRLSNDIVAAATHNTSVVDHQPRSKVAQDYNKLCSEVLEWQ